MRVELVDIEWLKPHEQIRDRQVKELLKMTLRWDAYTKPMLVDESSGTILDGHHRYTVGIRLGLALLPVILVDYLGDASIELDVWPACGIDSLTKQQVLDMAHSSELFPPKTSRHRIAIELPPISVSLDDLRQS